MLETPSLLICQLRAVKDFSKQPQEQRLTCARFLSPSQADSRQSSDNLSGISSDVLCIYPDIQSDMHSGKSSDIVSDRLSSTSSDILPVITYLLTVFLATLLKFFLTFFLASFVTIFLAHHLAGFLTFVLAYLLTIFLAFYLANLRRSIYNDLQPCLPKFHVFIHAPWQATGVYVQTH